MTGAALPPLPPGRWQVDCRAPGGLDGLAVVEDGRAEEPLGPKDVRIAVRAAGVNHRDLLSVLDPGSGCPLLGVEAAGEVVATGALVHDLVPGDRVLGLLPGAFAPVAVTDRRLLTRLPSGWSFTDGASAPVAYVTAWYALRELAGLTGGESLLVHAAATGVGSAAVRLARLWGVDVHTTASRAKWHAVRALGVPPERISCSRTPEFASRVLAATGGRGVDVVLNALTGELLDATVRVTAPGGRFLALGVLDVREDLGPSVRQLRVDLAEAGVPRVAAIFAALAPHFAAGGLPPLPVTTFDVRRVREAFGLLHEGRHIGKVVLTVPPGASSRPAAA
ncbi:NADPH:quinone reductase-like Zn-dependent oxidoreductase [Crossiella equi]|uniref:NADPH:quinone reductase-like Zn-dependent oxidoreductase n=1 Tax=Crossiella equi TaxID=130796 RepID=A0ABS5A7Z0_9PSEU|nr:zinc-binding dehydrogenase [Crossiella equi]MBP2472367.1 NADPH:quinone reductase-like Zn-dependent oxidoreductase [Crossiella equi]